MTKEIPNQFFKSLSKLEIKIQPKNVNVKFENNKELVNNRYNHIHIYDVSASYLGKMTRNFIRKIKSFLGRFNKTNDKTQHHCLLDVNF